MKNKLAGKRVLVTGAGGFIGSHLAESLVRQGSRVRALLHYNATGNIANLNHVDKKTRSEMEIVFGDIQDGYFCERVAKGTEVIFHLAALAGIPYSYVAPLSYVQTNIVGTLNLLNSGLKNGVGLFLHTSSSEVYGTAIYKPIDENHPLQGQSPYSASKIGADKIVESYWRSYDLNAVTLRPFNTYGPRQSPRAVIPTIISQALRSNKIYIGSLEPKRDLTYVSDTVEAYLKAAAGNNLKGETIHFGTGNFYSVREIIEATSSLLKKELEIVAEKERMRPEKSEVLELLCNNAKARKMLNWRPRIGLKEGLQEVLAFLEKSNIADSRKYHI
jgi:NAD dependent epimerase/dehydratase